MTHITTRPASGEEGLPSSQILGDIRERIIAALAKVRVVDRSEIDQEIAAEGDAVMDSPEAMVVVSTLEKELGRTLPGPEGLRCDEYESVEALTSLIAREIREW